MFSASTISVLRVRGLRQFSIVLASAALITALADSSARGATSDSMRITFADGTPVIAHPGLYVDYKIGSAPTVVVENGHALEKIELPEPALETTDEGRMVVNIKGYATINPDIQIGLGSRSAYLMEPNDPTVVSDIIQCVTRQNTGNIFQRDFEITMISTPDPALAFANPLPGDFNKPETGAEQDVSTGLFLATPGSAQTVAPFHVWVFSDVEVPEPSAMMLMALGGLAVFELEGWDGRKRRCAARPA